MNTAHKNDNSPARETKTATVIHSIKGTNRKPIPRNSKVTIQHFPVLYSTEKARI